MWLTYDDGFWGMKIAHLGIVFIIATLLLYHEKEKTDTSCCHLSESIKTIASIYVCLPLRRFFPSLSNTDLFSTMDLLLSTVFFLGIAVHTQGLPYTLVKVWVFFSYLAQSISANVLHLNRSLYVWIVDQLAEESFDSKTPSKVLHSFWRAKSWVESSCSSFFGWAPKF